MRGFNKAIVMGNLGKDPELRYTNSGVPVANFSVATSESWTNKQTQNREERTEWHNIVVWGKMGENCAEYLKKGRQVLVEGRIQTRSWDDKEGKKRYTTEIVANNVQFLGTRGASPSGPADEASPGDVTPPEPPKSGGAFDADDDIPF